MTYVVKVLIAPEPTPASDEVKVRWTRRMDHAQRPVLLQLAEQIENLDGVEEVALRRYSALIKIATHVVTVETLMQQIGEVFTDEDFIHSPAVRLSEFRFDVTVIGHLITVGN